MVKRKHFGKKSKKGFLLQSKKVGRYFRLALRASMVFILVVAGALLSKAYMNGTKEPISPPTVQADVTPPSEPQPVADPLSDPVPVAETELPVLDTDPLTKSAAVVEEEPMQVDSATDHVPAWIKNALPKPSDAKKPYIVVVIDDMGVNVKRSRDIIELQAPLTLSFLPYASNLPEITKRSQSFGHELMVHVPMQTETKAYPGPNALNVDLEEDEIQRRLNIALTQFTGYVGINNHMGGRFTSDARGMEFVMQTIKKREYLFLDSVTTAKSVCPRLAKLYDVPFARRDIFIDHEETDKFVNKQLINMEKIARERGYAIGIGHPKRITVEHLRAWLPTLKDKGFSLVPLTTVLLDK